MGHLGGGRSRRQPRRHRRGHAGGDGDPDRPCAPGDGGGRSADRSNPVGVRARRAAEPRTAPGVGSGRRRASRGRHRTRTDAVRRAPPTEAGPGGPSARSDPAGHPRGLRRPVRVPHGHRDAATLPRGRWRSPAGVGRAATPAVAGGDVRVPSGVDGGAAAFERAGDRPRGGRRCAVVPALPADARGAGDLPGDRGHPAAAGTGGVRARRGELHEVGSRPGRGAGARARRGARGASRSSCPCRCSSRDTTSRTPPRSWTSGPRCARPERCFVVAATSSR